ncbi:DUF4288 domain-containing protein [Bacillus sp. FJAT-49736]|uniref:DUF4288 domain-containing protein n=1 Tax=Bacillus sp. FJAT-49736 TaxID=2833582 RepID=UPI001BC9C4EC|nr:DUF4288 domain-containing protein [Bacillus sp. FJAT-49736]MBS4171725.1 DUF4288 domain-containing protein [Bacillus sp. FJAT-49736]
MLKFLLDKRGRLLKDEWYAVKLIYEFLITGEPDPAKIDQDYNTDKQYEENIIIVKANSFEHAFSIAEMRAKEKE